MRILHITESFGAGVAGAICDYVRSTPEHEHHLLMSSRREAVDPVYLELFASTIHVARSVRSARSAHSITRRVAPDIVHLHSSIAGAVFRATAPLRTSYRLVYTPHCFAFERRDIGSAQRFAFRFIERILARRTDLLAACSPREIELARELGYRELRLVPNRAEPFTDERELAPVETARKETSKLRVVTAGRISPQKDPSFFANVVGSCNSDRTEFVWIGGGDDSLISTLARRDVHVTGWLTRDATNRELTRADLYIHTASWEGFPIAIIEAHRRGLPVLVRKIPAFNYLPDDVTAATPAEMGRRIEEIFHAPGARQANLDLWHLILASNTAEDQRNALLAAYL